MEERIPVTSGEIIFGKDFLNYKDVLDDFKRAKCIRVMTFNISKKDDKNEVINALKNVSEDVDVKIITNIPSRMERYFDLDDRAKMRKNFKNNVDAYLEKLNPKNFSSNTEVRFNFSNHAKIIGTENILYVESANYSDESKNNIEIGTIITNTETIQKVYKEIFLAVIDESIPYLENNFNNLRLFVSRMEKEFKCWLDKYDNNLHFLESDLVENMLLNPIDVEALMDDYFMQRVPFENKKPNEFKDAIMINAIKNYRPMTGMKVCVVSNDDGFRKAFEGDKRFLTFKFLSDFLKHYTLSEEALVLIAEVISDEVADGTYDDIIKEYISDFDIDRVYYGKWSIDIGEWSIDSGDIDSGKWSIDSGDIDSGDIDEIDCELLYVEKLESSYIANFNVEVSISIDITYRDEYGSFYDDEEETYLLEHVIQAIEHHRFNINIAIEYEIDEDDENINISFANVLDNTRHKYITLDEDTIYDSEEIEDAVYKYIEEADLVYCSQCGELLLDRSFSYCDLDDNPLCEDCAMSTDSMGAVCPMCGRKVPHEYMTSGFCRDCEPDS